MQPAQPNEPIFKENPHDQQNPLLESQAARSGRTDTDRTAPGPTKETGPDGALHEPSGNAADGHHRDGDWHDVVQPDRVELGLRIVHVPWPGVFDHRPARLDQIRAGTAADDMAGPDASRPNVRMIILRSLVILDLIFMVQAARKRLYLELRGECAEPEEANRSLLGVVGFWANLSSPALAGCSQRRIRCKIGGRRPVDALGRQRGIAHPPAHAPPRGRASR